MGKSFKLKGLLNIASVFASIGIIDNTSIDYSHSNTGTTTGDSYLYNLNGGPTEYVIQGPGGIAGRFAYAFKNRGNGYACYIDASGDLKACSNDVVYTFMPLI